MKSSNSGKANEEPGGEGFQSDSKEKGRAGRPNSLSHEKTKELLDMYYSHPLSLRDLADRFGVSRMTVWRVVQGAATPGPV